MKIKFDIDCTPEELRGFFGLPEVKPMQDDMIKEIGERLRANVKTLDAETMLKTWLPAGIDAMKQFQDFFGQMAAAAARKK